MADRGNRRIQVFQMDGTFVRKWGSSGSGDGQFSSPYGIAIDTNGLVYVTDYSNHRIQVFQPDGTFVRKWGSYGSAPGQFSDPSGVAIGLDGLVYVVDSYNNNRIQVFDSNGTFVRKWSVGGQPRLIAISSDKLVYTDRGVYELDGTVVRGALPPSSLYGIAISTNGQIFVTGYYVGNYVDVYARAFRNPSALPRNFIPEPVLLAVEQRGGTPYLDIDYEVIDRDNPTVTVAALAFVDGSNTLSHILRLNSLIEGTATNVGPAVPANRVNRLTWNAAADWSTNFGNVKIEILANDGRDLLDFHFLTIPSNGPDPELVIDRSPVTQPNMLSCWYWLIATNDAAVNLATGKVYNVSDGKLLAQGTSTTADGRAFLFQRLGVREATTAEVTRAKTAYTPGVTNQWTPRVSGDPRQKVNELGIDTYNYGTNAWFVVKP